MLSELFCDGLPHRNHTRLSDLTNWHIYSRRTEKTLERLRRKHDLYHVVRIPASGHYGEHASRLKDRIDALEMDFAPWTSFVDLDNGYEFVMAFRRLSDAITVRLLDE